MPGSTRTFRKLLTPFLDPLKGGAARVKLAIAIVLLIAGSVSLAYFQLVVLKMLPFDNKSEFQVVVDMPVGTPVEETARVLHEIGAELAKEADVVNYQAYAGTASPINFNGLVRQYYLRAVPEKGDIQVNLADKQHRSRQSHEIAVSVRERIEAIGKTQRRCRQGGRSAARPAGHVAHRRRGLWPRLRRPDGGWQAGARGLRADGRHRRHRRLHRGGFAQVRAARAAEQGGATRGGAERHRRGGRHGAGRHGRDASAQYRIEIRDSGTRALCRPRQQSTLDALLKLRVRSREGRLVPVSELVEVRDVAREKAIYHKDLLPVVYVIGDMGGKLDSPLYGMFDIRSKVKDARRSRQAGTLGEWFIRQPADPYAGYSHQVGRRVAGDLRNLPRHGHRLCGRPDPDLPAGGGAVPQLPRAADHHGADPADHHRRDARPCAAGQRSSPPPR